MIDSRTAPYGAFVLRVGLGTMFISNTAKVRMARAALAVALRKLLNRSRTAVLVQNLDDRAVIERLTD